MQGNKPSGPLMRSEPIATFASDQTEQQARQTVLSACQDLDANGLNTAGLLSMGHRWKRSGAPGVLTTPASPANPFDSWCIHSFEWHALLPETARLDPWPGEPTMTAQPTHERWLGLYRGLLNEFRATQAILLLSSPYASALACLPSVQSDGLPPIHPAVAALGPSGVACAPFVATGSPELDQNALEVVITALGAGHACLLSNLGMLVMGESVRQAANRAKCLEGIARVYSLALQMGEPVALDADAINLGFDAWQHPI